MAGDHSCASLWIIVRGSYHNPRWQILRISLSSRPNRPLSCQGIALIRSRHGSLCSLDSRSHKPQRLLGEAWLCIVSAIIEVHHERRFMQHPGGSSTEGQPRENREEDKREA